MASTDPPEASEIRRRGRRRLIGAIALVALLVVFVPMALDSEPRKSREGPSAAIPPKENAPPLPSPKPAAAPPAIVAPAATVAPVETGAPSPKVAAVSPQAAESKVVSPPAPKAPQAAPEAASPQAASPKLEGFAVQVGAFRDEAKLKQAREKLAAAGVVHYTERLEAKAGPLTRLRAGPFPTRAEAEAAQVKLKRAAVEGKVVPLP